MVARCLALSAAWHSGPALALVLARAVVAAAAARHSLGHTHIAPAAAVVVAAVHIRPGGRCSSHRSRSGHVRVDRSRVDRSRIDRSHTDRSRTRRNPRIAAGPAAHNPGRDIVVAAAVAAVAERRTAGAGMPWLCGAVSSIVYRIELSHALWARLSSSCGSRPLNVGVRPLNPELGRSRP